jgi:PAS domain S-box-containing protein
MNSRVIDVARTMATDSAAVVATDVSGRVLYWSKGAEELYGWAEGDVLGRNIVDVTPTEMSRPEAESIMKQLAAGQRWTGEFLVRSRRGVRFTAEVTDIPVRDDEGTLLGIVGISQRRSYLP